MKYIRWFLRTARPYSFPLALLILCGVIQAACTIFFVYVCKQLVDCAVAAFSGAGPEPISKWFFCLLAVVLIRVVLNAFRAFIQTKTEIRMKNALRRRLFTIMLRMQSDGALKHHSGDIINRIQEGCYLSIILKKTYDLLVKARNLFIRLIPARIMGAATVKHISATVATLILWYSFLV